MREEDREISTMKKTEFYSFFVIMLCMIILGISVQSCNRYDDESSGSMDNNIVNSVELEEYIIAASDFKQSLAIFEKEINNVDFSKLEVSYDTDGRKITRLPASFASIKIEEKLQIFNEKKETFYDF
jgi:hypothetical protein